MEYQLSPIFYKNGQVFGAKKLNNNSLLFIVFKKWRLNYKLYTNKELKEFNLYA
jgi:hypothetical protein